MCAESDIPESSASRSSDNDDVIGPWGRLKFEFIRGFLWTWTRCFSLKGLYLLGAAFGVCEWMLNYNRRRRFRQHLRTGFGKIGMLDKADARRACLQQFIRTRCDKLFYLIFDKLPKETILSRVRFVREPDLAQAAARGKGVYVCTSHIGSMHVVGLIMALKGYRVAGVRDPKEGAARRYIQQKYEETFPEFSTIRILYANMYPRDIYRCFQEGYIMGSSLDVGRQRAAQLRTITVNLFDQPRDFAVGPVQIALRCGAPIYQTFLLSRKDFYFDLLLLGPLAEPESTSDSPETLKEVLQKYADNIAEFLAEHPDHISRT
jgi:lauroyl/myristoyl acyltransferase